MNRFIEKPDCYLDTETGLEWQKEQNPNKMDWHQAKGYCKSLGAGWRLPTRKELFSLTEDNEKEPCTGLPGMTSDSYWSSTTYALNTADYAWRVGFVYGNIYGDGKHLIYYVRAVRSGQPKLNTDKALKDEIARLKRRLEIINKLSA